MAAFGGDLLAASEERKRVSARWLGFANHPKQRLCCAALGIKDFVNVDGAWIRES